MIYLKKLMMTLVLLMTAATGAWAGHAVPYMVGDENNTDVYFSKKSNVLTIQEGQEATFEFTNYTRGNDAWENWVCSIQASDYQHIADIRADRWDNVAGNGDNFTYCNYLDMLGDAATFKAKMQGATVVLKAIYDQGKIRVEATMTPTSGDPLVMVYEKTYTLPQAKVCLTIDKSHLVITKEEIISYVAPTESANEWELTMPAGNVLLNVAYKDRTATKVMFGTTEMTSTSNTVTGYLGFEEAFTNQIAATVQNIEPTFNQGQATPVNDATVTYTSSDATVIAFGSNNAASGALENIKFLKTGSAKLTAQYAGSDDLGSSELELAVTVAAPATLTLASNDAALGTAKAVMPSLVSALQLTVPDDWNGDNTKLTADDMPGFKALTLEQAMTWTGAPTDKVAFLAFCFAFSNVSQKELLHTAIFDNGAYDDEDGDVYTRKMAYNIGYFYYTTGYTPSNVIDNGDGTYSVLPNTQVTLKPNPTEGNEFKEWNEGADVSDNEDGTWTLTVGEAATTINLTATFGEITYAVKMADPTDAEAKNWTIASGNSSVTGDVAEGLTGLKAGDEGVTLTYNGRLKVKSVTATTDAAPAATLQSITVGKGSTGLSEDKVLYYMPGDTYRQALARTENQSTGGLGWGYWEDSSLTTLFFKEVTTKAWDVAIDGDSNFGSGKGTCTITLDTEINPTGHTFQFVNAQ